MLGIKLIHISERDQVCCGVLASLDFTYVLQGLALLISSSSNFISDSTYT